MNEIEKEVLQTVSACHEVEVGALNTAVSLLKDTVEKQEFQISAYHTDISMLKTKVEKLKRDYAKESHELEQILGKALGYPIYPEGGPGPVGDVCVGDNVPASLAMEAAHKIAALQVEVADLHQHAQELARGKNEVLAEAASSHTSFQPMRI